AQGAGHRVGVDGLLAQERGPDEDGAQRRAQLVRDDGQELVLALVGGLGLEPRHLLAPRRLLAVPRGLEAGDEDAPGLAALPPQRAVAQREMPLLDPAVQLERQATVFLRRRIA